MVFLEALNVQRRVVGALMIRELHTRYGRDDFGFLWFLLEPLLFIFGVVAMWRMLRGGYEHDLPVIPMVFMGYPPLLLWRHIISRAMACVRPNTGLLYHRQVTVLDLFISRVLIEIAGNLAAMLLCFAVLYAAGFLDWPANLPMMYLGYLSMAVFATSLALTMAALSERSEVVEKIWTPMMYLTNPFTGAIAMAQWLPDKYREYYLMIPTVHAFEMIRSGYFGEAVQNYGNPWYIGAWSAGFAILGLWLLRHVKQHVVME